MRTYEVLFIVAPTETEETVDGLIEHLSGVATERGATISKVDKMGRRRLAYPIRRAHANVNDGTYVVLTLEGNGSEIAELERRLRVAETVIRYLTVRIDEDLKRAEKFKVKRASRGRSTRDGGRRRGQSIDSAVFAETPDADGAETEQEENS